MWTAIISISLLALIAGLVLGYAEKSLPAANSGLVDRVDRLLPQTQCAQCGYPGCRPYAAAIVDAGAAINLCPPGGTDTIRRLADLLGRDMLPLAEPAPAEGLVAVIDESRCIGCTHCRSACPVDAIVGAQQLMHTVIAAECTGCELCIAPCPVDCIELRQSA
jgi:electron transport complex protein RnfB